MSSRIQRLFKQHERSVMLIRIVSALSSMIVGRLFKPLTSRMLLRAFCTPVVRLNPTAAEQAILDAGERFTWRSGGAEATGWRWGEGPAVLLVHGWAGRAAQLTSFVPALTARGFSVIALDQPAHGESPGSRTHAVEMKEILMALYAKTGPLAGIVAHSLGGLVTSFALSQGMESGSIALISSPSAPGPYFEQLMNMARIPVSRRNDVRQGAEAIFGDTFDRIAMRNSWRANRTPALLVHDRGDRQVPFAAAGEIHQSLPHAERHATEGLGHNRILKDADVVNAVADFIQSSTPAAAQPLALDFTQHVAAASPPDTSLISIDEVMADLAFGRS